MWRLNMNSERFWCDWSWMTDLMSVGFHIRSKNVWRKGAASFKDIEVDVLEMRKKRFPETRVPEPDH